MEQREITDVLDYIKQNGRSEWQIWYRRDDGRIHVHAMPKNIFEARAAEYDIDPEDKYTLLDVVMYEPHIPSPHQPRNHADDPAFRKGYAAIDPRDRMAGRLDRPVPATLFNADTKADARNAHLERVRAAKQRVQITIASGVQGDPLQKIRDRMIEDVEWMEDHRRVVNDRRDRALGRKQALTMDEAKADLRRRRQRVRPKRR